MPKPLPLYGGEIKANQIGAFIRGGLALKVIRPGYDSQGRRRQAWTQIVHEDIPIWEVKRERPLEEVLTAFDKKWVKHMKDVDVDLVVEMTKNARRKAFKDGVSGQAPAPSLTRDGRTAGLVYHT